MPTEPVSDFCYNLTVASNLLVPVCIYVNSLILCEGHVKLSVKPQSFAHMCKVILITKLLCSQIIFAAIIKVYAQRCWPN